MMTHSTYVYTRIVVVSIDLGNCDFELSVSIMGKSHVD